MELKKWEGLKLHWNAVLSSLLPHLWAVSKCLDLWLVLQYLLSTYCGYLCTELLSFQCTEQLTWWCTPNKCLPTYTAGLKRRSVLSRQSLKINQLRKLYYRYQRCTHSHALDRASILQWKMGLKYSLDSIIMSFFLLMSALDCGVWVESWVWAPECCVLPGQPSREQMGEKPSACVFFHLNLFIPLFKHQYIVCQPLMDYVEGGLCFQHLLIDLASSHPAW